jgi:hypothetical protein
MQELELSETVGNDELCAWRVAPAWVWIQTRVPAIAAILARRSAFRQVAYGVAGGYLRTFESQMTLKQASALLDDLQNTIRNQLKNT